MTGPLDGIRVVELGVWVAGPGAAGILADWGADVVKIEPPAGDPARSFQRMLGGDLDVNPVFELDNRGKRGIALDLSTERGVEIADRLLAGADVFLTNVRPAALDRLGLGPDDVRRAPPAPRLRPHHGLRARRTRRRQGRLRHRRLLGPGRHRRVAACARRPAAVPARRHGRPLGRHDRRRHGQRRPGGPGPHRPRPSGVDLAAPPGRLHHRLRRERGADVGPQPGHRHARDHVQPDGQQLHRRRRPPVLDRRARGRAPLAGTGPSGRTARVADRPPLRRPAQPGRQRRRS